MSKVKQWAADVAEKAVDDILTKVKNKIIDLKTAKDDILKIENLALVDIDEDNIDEVLEMELKI
jgi:hypothetical protein|tara:strand:+ start:2380 stop:2571 length:192 start_codon:yes stop_codon:yes gene_type:complete